MNPAVSIPSTSSLPSSALLKTSFTKLKLNDIETHNHHELVLDYNCLFKYFYCLYSLFSMVYSSTFNITSIPQDWLGKFNAF